MTCRSISGTLTGAVEIGSGGVLYCDDLIEDLEESLNPLRLQAKYDAYLNQLKDRKKLGALELMVGTRWNVFDPLGRIQDQYAGNDRYRFRVISALDENGESNFNYQYGLGFDTAYYRDMKESIDDANLGDSDNEDLEDSELGTPLMIGSLQMYSHYIQILHSHIIY